MRMVWANVVNALVGVWFIIAPFVLNFQDVPNAMWTSIVGGLILLILAGWAVFSEPARKQKWIQYVNGLVGIWFVLFPFIFTMSDRVGVLWTSIIGGLLALVLSAWMAFGVLAKEEPAR
ncbi:MAG: SPW repeat protein [Armatimonadota bacterium]|nr:SPW repeat protein [Armatimonadota bacterium]MDR7550602.1 SPW repeat protein [Armatimonadota bacterium]